MNREKILLDVSILLVTISAITQKWLCVCVCAWGCVGVCGWVCGCVWVGGCDVQVCV